MIDVEKLARALHTKTSLVSQCTYALIQHFCTQLETLSQEQGATKQPPEPDIFQTVFREPQADSIHTAQALLSWWTTDFTALHGDFSPTRSSNAKVKPDWLVETFRLESPVPSIHVICAAETAFSLLIRLLAHNAVAAQLDGRVPCATIATPDVLQDIVGGDYFTRHHIDYCFPDAYSWFLFSWDPDVTPLFTALIDALYAFDSEASASASASGHATPRVNPPGDWLKPLYEALFPRPLRHALGEYYTPDWLAEYTVRETTRIASALPWQTQFLDPTCGSGTFLRKLIEWTRSTVAPAGLGTNVEPPTAADQLNALCRTIRGFDVSLLAVIMARTNYLFAVIDLIDGVTSVSLPVDWFDVIDRRTPEFTVEQPLCTRVQKGPRAGVARLEHEWAVNRMRGAQRPKADVIVGNPPWVNWEYLPRTVRDRSEHLWRDYALFHASGRDLALSKEDISVLVTYAVIDHDLRAGGYLGFVLRQGVFKSKQNGVGFRRLQIGSDGPKLRVVEVDDLAAVQPFDDATNATAVVIIEKGAATQYPVHYRVWRTNKRRAFRADSSLATVLTAVEIEPQAAKPVQSADPTSVWLTLPPAALAAADKVLGANPYRARTGIFTGGANAVYWVQVLAHKEDGLVRITNYTERAKRQAPKVQADVEASLVYPLLRGSDVHRWSAVPSLHIICPHTATTKMAAIPRLEMAAEYPRTLTYLEAFAEMLQARRGFSWDRYQLASTPYAIQRIGAYTFSPYKVAWRYISSSFICAVVSTVGDPVLGNRLVLPNEKLMYISTDTPDEAYYLCGVLSATPVRVCVERFMNPTSISTHVLEKIAIPAFDAQSPLHQAIAALCEHGHALTGHPGHAAALSELNVQLDTAVCTLYAMNAEELQSLARLAAP